MPILPYASFAIIACRSWHHAYYARSITHVFLDCITCASSCIFDECKVVVLPQGVLECWCGDELPWRWARWHQQSQRADPKRQLRRAARAGCLRRCFQHPAALRCHVARIVGQLVAPKCVEGLTKGLDLMLLRRPACVVDRKLAVDEIVGTLCVTAVFFGQEPVFSAVGECDVSLRRVTGWS